MLKLIANREESRTTRYSQISPPILYRNHECRGELSFVGSSNRMCHPCLENIDGNVKESSECQGRYQGDFCPHCTVRIISYGHRHPIEFNFCKYKGSFVNRIVIRCTPKNERYCAICTEVIDEASFTVCNRPNKKRSNPDTFPISDCRSGYFCSKEPCRSIARVIYGPYVFIHNAGGGDAEGV